MQLKISIPDCKPLLQKTPRDSLKLLVNFFYCWKIGFKANRSGFPSTKIVFSTPWLTSHFNFKENKVLKKNIVQITGQMMRPSQKIRASASVEAATVGTWKEKLRLLVPKSKPTINDKLTEEEDFTYHMHRTGLTKKSSCSCPVPSWCPTVHSIFIHRDLLLGSSTEWNSYKSAHFYTFS